MFVRIEELLSKAHHAAVEYWKSLDSSSEGVLRNRHFSQCVQRYEIELGGKGISRLLDMPHLSMQNRDGRVLLFNFQRFQRPVEILVF